MSFNAVAEQDAITAAIIGLCGGRVYEGSDVPEEEELERDEDGLVLPYIVVGFGALFPNYADRSIEGERQQPYVMPVVIECWAGDSGACRATAGAVRDILVDWTSGPNMASLALRSGGFFPPNGSRGRPSRSLETVVFTSELNYSVDVDA